MGMLFPRVPPPVFRVTKLLYHVKTHRRFNTSSGVPKVDQALQAISIVQFRDKSDDLSKPLLLRGEPGGSRQPAAVGGTLPAAGKWFVDGNETRAVRLDFSYLEGGETHRDVSHRRLGRDGRGLKSFSSTTRSFLYPYEVMSPQLDSNGNDAVLDFYNWVRNSIGEDDIPDITTYRELLASLLSIPMDSEKPRFHQILGPLWLLDLAQRYNAERPAGKGPVSFYMAQQPISELPKHLRGDLPTPRLALEAGRGDIYASSIWLGLEPTSTPLHRDPNHNIFTQLRGAKVVRLLRPEFGRRLFRAVQAELGARGSPNMRGVEMMAGPERELLDHKVWAWGSAGSEEEDAGAPLEGMAEAVVRPGDSLFVPMGWWHSVKSEFADGRLNASVNWWFR